MKQLSNIAVTLCVVFAMLLAMSVSAVCAPWDGNDYEMYPNENPERDYEKRYCDATLEDDFTDDDILVSILPDWHDKEYTVADFADIDCISVRVSMKNAGASGLVQLLHLKIADGSKQKVLDSIKILEAREDIQAAEPCFRQAPATGERTLIPVVIALLLSGTGLVVVVSKKKQIA